METKRYNVVSHKRVVKAIEEHLIDRNQTLGDLAWRYKVDKKNSKARIYDCISDDKYGTLTYHFRINGKGKPGNEKIAVNFQPSIGAILTFSILITAALSTTGMTLYLSLYRLGLPLPFIFTPVWRADSAVYDSLFMTASSYFLLGVYTSLYAYWKWWDSHFRDEVYALIDDAITTSIDQ